MQSALGRRSARIDHRVLVAVAQMMTACDAIITRSVCLSRTSTSTQIRTQTGKTPTCYTARQQRHRHHINHTTLLHLATISSNAVSSQQSLPTSTTACRACVLKYILEILMTNFQIRFCSQQ